MYWEQLKLNRRPFPSVPDADNCVEIGSVFRAMARAEQAIQRGTGPVIVIGPSGCGKTTLLESLAARFTDELLIVKLYCAKLNTRFDLLQNIAFELGLPYRDVQEGELRLNLIDFLQPSEECPNGILLLVDEGQLLGYRLLEEIRLITNVVRDGQPRVRLVIAGSRSLEERIGHPKLDSLNQRIAARCYVEPLNRDETSLFVLAQLDKAGRDGLELFHPDALVTIHQLTDGVPRQVNQLADFALGRAAQLERIPVDSTLVKTIWTDLQSLPCEPVGELAVATDATSGTVVEFGPLDESAQAGSEDTGSDEEQWLDELQTQANRLVPANGAENAANITDTVDWLGHSVESDPIATNPLLTTPVSDDPFRELFDIEESIEERHSEPVLQGPAVSASDFEDSTTWDATDLPPAGIPQQRTDSLGWPIPAPLQEIDHWNSTTEEIVGRHQEQVDAGGGQHTHIVSTDDEAAATPPSQQDAKRRGAPVQPPVVSFGHGAGQSAKRAAPSSDDDREIIVITNVDDHPVSATRDSQPASPKSPSTGRAVRMDYRDLFQQLESNGSQGRG